jgi:hypothetical protein
MGFLLLKYFYWGLSKKLCQSEQEEFGVSHASEISPKQL